MSLGRTIVICAAFGVIAVGAVLGALELRRRRVAAVQDVPPAVQAPWAVRTAHVQQGTVERTFPALAEVVSRRDVVISGQVFGTVLWLAGREGTPVHAGDVLARIDTRDLDEQRAALVARAAAARAEAADTAVELQRSQELFASGVESQSSVDAASARAVSTEQQARALERDIAAIDVRIGYGEIRATAPGRISARIAEPGDLCVPGHALLRIAEEDGVRLRVALPQTVLERVAAGGAVHLRHGGETMTVPIARVFPELDERALGTVEIDLGAGPFGMPSGARIAADVVLTRLDDALNVPPRALLAPGDGTSARVFRVSHDGGHATVAPVGVTVQVTARDAVAISGDLSAGDEVVVAHPTVLLRLQAGDPVIATPSAR